VWLFAFGGGIVNIILGIVYGIKANNGEWAEFPLIGGWILKKLFSTDFICTFGRTHETCCFDRRGLLVVAAFVPFLHSTTGDEAPLFGFSAESSRPERQWREIPGDS